jgi:hypothetical protein
VRADEDRRLVVAAFVLRWVLSAIRAVLVVLLLAGVVRSASDSRWAPAIGLSALAGALVWMEWDDHRIRRRRSRRAA